MNHSLCGPFSATSGAVLAAAEGHVCRLQVMGFVPQRRVEPPRPFPWCLRVAVLLGSAAPADKSPLLGDQGREESAQRRDESRHSQVAWGRGGMGRVGWEGRDGEAARGELGGWMQSGTRAGWQNRHKLVMQPEGDAKSQGTIPHNTIAPIGPWGGCL